MTPTGTEATCTKATCTTWGINYNSQLVSDTVEPQGVRDIQTYCQTTQAATSGRRHGLHNPGTRNTVNVNHGELLHTEVQLSSMEYGHLYTANPVQPVPHVQHGADSSTTPVQQLPTFAKAAVSTHKGTPSLQQANVLLSPHAPWSYEDKSSPLHARSTALLANHDAVGKPAGHQIKAADTPVWCQTTPVDVVSLEAAAVQPLLDTAAVQPTVVQQPHETELNATNSLGQYDVTTNTCCMCEHAAHQAKTTDPPVQCQLPSEESSEPRKNVRARAWSGKQLLTILMISSTAMFLVRQAGQHPAQTDKILNSPQHGQHPSNPSITYKVPADGSKTWSVIHNNTIVIVT